MIRSVHFCNTMFGILSGLCALYGESLLMCLSSWFLLSCGGSGSSSDIHTGHSL